MAHTKDEVLSALRTCQDPEIPVNIVDLGLVYDVTVESAEGGPCDVLVKMTLTSPGCPMSQAITKDVRRRLLELPKVRSARVEIVWEPLWHPDMITEVGRQHLKIA